MPKVSTLADGGFARSRKRTKPHLEEECGVRSGYWQDRRRRPAFPYLGASSPAFDRHRQSALSEARSSSYIQYILSCDSRYEGHTVDGIAI